MADEKRVDPRIGRFESENNGFALVAVLIFSTFLTMIGISIVVMSTTEVMISYNNLLRGKALYVAEGGLENQIADLKVLSGDRDIPTVDELLSISQVPPNFGSYSYSQYGVERDGEAFTHTITVGPYAGLYALVQPYRMVSNVTGPRNTKMNIELSSEHHLIPIFQFSIFYDQDLEIFPGPEMTIGGRVHSNGNLHLGCDADLYFNGFVTSAGALSLTRKDGQPGPPGDVWIKDDEGIFQKMLFDSSDPNWEDRSIRRWGGRVQDQTHGIVQIGMPLPVGVDAIEVIKRGEIGDSELLHDSRFYYRADLKIIDGVATDIEGLPVSLTEGIMSTHTFYNFREGKWLFATQIDIGEMIAAGQVPGNGILYVSASETSPGARDAVIRLVNGQQLPDGGLTVASDNPLYILGDYNVIESQPSSVLSDAFNVLSNSWDDVNSDQSIGQRRASDTTLRVGVVAGTIETTPGNYNGGIENFPRFLEDWAGMTMTYVGSLVCMWISEWATGEWTYGGEYYISPKRDWSFDTAFYNPDQLPPGSPNVLNFEPGDWIYYRVR
jgi:hypothetical protein